IAFLGRRGKVKRAHDRGTPARTRPPRQTRGLRCFLEWLAGCAAASGRRVVIFRWRRLNHEWCRPRLKRPRPSLSTVRRGLECLQLLPASVKLRELLFGGG